MKLERVIIFFIAVVSVGFGAAMLETHPSEAWPKSSPACSSNYKLCPRCYDCHQEMK